MSPKDKAKDLIDKMYYCHEKINEDIAKKYALIAVDEIILANPTWFINQMESSHKYWEEVRDILNNL